ncbi:MAG: hypothetical protein AABM40_15360 [Chloroflexota bacterium]
MVQGYAAVGRSDDERDDQARSRIDHGHDPANADYHPYVLNGRDAQLQHEERRGDRETPALNASSRLVRICLV